VNRRAFFRSSATGFCALAAAELASARSLFGAPREGAELVVAKDLSRVEARYYRKLPQREVECHICPRNCRVADRERGYCRTRENRGGTYHTLVHGRPCSVHIDPIEKKPFFHFLPGSLAFSFATAGCNVNCKFCQNWEISQARPEETQNLDLPPQRLVSLAKSKRAPIIASTYSEPTVFNEYVYDTARLAREKGIKSVTVSNGFIEREPLRALCGVLDAIKIDLKAFSEKYYRDIVRGELAPILNTLKALRAAGIWFEIVNLMVPSLNDGPDEIRQMCKWVKANLGVDVPIHFTRFHPMYLLKNLPSTPVSTLERSRNIALQEGLHYVYIGNVPGHEGEHTYCPKCKQAIIRRAGFTILENRIKDGKCGSCGAKIAGVWG
jgi:pyruvate formate lyase activating enzyme